MISIPKIAAVGLKEFRQVRRDPMSLLMLVGLPAMMLVLYGFALNFDVRHVALAVQDRDLSTASRDLVASFVNSTYFDITATPEPGADLERLTERRVAKAVLVIPEGFGSDLAAGRRASVQLLLDGADSTTASTILGYAGSLVSESNERRLRIALVASGANEGDKGRDLFVYEPRVWYNPELSSTQFLVPGLAGTLLMLTAVLSTSLSIVRERERGSMEQLRVAPLRTVELILGKTVPYLLLSFVATIVILGAARVLFGIVVRGPYLALFVVTLVYLLGALGLGLLISTIADSQALAFQMALLVSLLPSVLLSGFIFQIRSMPVVLQAITHVVPARYFLIVLRGIILKGTGLEPYWDQLGFLALFTVLVLGLASVRMANEEM
ncbi:MAG TPA: ABC transporter permease [Vicinamibacteria bacterium]